jgi:hypothetical protein
MHEVYTEQVAPVVAQKWAAKVNDDPGNPDRTKEPKAGFRAEVAREVFKELSKEEQLGFSTRAKEEAAEKKEAYQKALKDPASQLAVDRQK